MTEGEIQMTTRYATIVTDGDGNEVVSSIGQFEAGPPKAGNGTVEQVADGVMIGMIRGGTKDAVGDWGFPDGTLGATGRAAKIAQDDAKVLRTAAAAKTPKPDKPAKRPSLHGRAKTPKPVKAAKPGPAPADPVKTSEDA
jgi:hypothetical protein